MRIQGIIQAICCLTVLTHPLSAQTIDRKRVEQLMDSTVNAVMKARNIPGAAAAILFRDSTAVAKAYGVANRETGEPVTRHTVFQLASTTKPFTAFVIMKLVERKRIELDAPARRYLSWLPDQYRDVTVQQLLTHTSGVQYDLRRGNVDEFSIVEFKRRLATSTPAFQPGTQWQYSNTGYALLSLIAEEITKQPFTTLLREIVFTPLGMNSSDYRAPENPINHAVGYDLVNGVLQRAPHVFSGFGNSGIESNIDDLINWMRAVDHRLFLETELYQLMQTRARLNDNTVVDFDFQGARSGYGFGWFLTSYRGARVITHGGAIAGFNSIISRFPGFTIIVLSNGKQGSDRVGQANAIANALFDAITTMPALQSKRVTTTMLLPRDQEIALALSAAPKDVADATSVYVYTANGFQSARNGTNGFTCLVNRDSFLEGYEVLKPTCWDAHGSATIVPVIFEIEKMRIAGKTPGEIVQEIRTRFSNKTFAHFSQPGIAYMLAGDVVEYDTATGRILKRAFPPHVMKYVTDPAQKNVDYESAIGYRYIVVREP